MNSVLPRVIRIYYDERMWFIALIALLFSGASIPLPGSFGTSPVVSPGDVGNKCYRLEPAQKVTLGAGSVVPKCAAQLEGKTYVRIRQMVKIIDAKIVEGSSNWGGCSTTEPSGYGALRKVGLPPVTYPASSEGDIFWEDLNYKTEDLKDFILVLTEKDSNYHTFDVYIDEAKKNDIPDYVGNCTEIGGLVPVPDAAAKPQFPPVAFATTDADFNAAFNLVFDNSCPGCEAAFNNAGLADKYFWKQMEKDALGIAEQVGVVTTTIDGESRNYDVKFHSGTVYLVGQSGQADDGKSWMYNASATKPPIEAAFDAESLKLKELKFVYVAPWTWATPECKPAIYLYPEEPMEVKVKVVPKGKITVSEPAHGDEGWTVIAYPDGTLETLGDLLRKTPSVDKITVYPYLYYETELEKVKVPEDGWIVEREELEEFFDQTLGKLGLNGEEIRDFKEYWVPKLSYGKSWFIGLIDRKELERVEPIEISSAPDTFIRIRFYFEEFKENFAPTEAIPLYLSRTGQSKILSLNPPTRKGFTAVDWGGILENGSCGLGERSE